jgi:hypothetical protein
MSASAPAVREKKNRGRVDEATIKPTQVLDPVSSSISHDPATCWMKVPAAENMFAPHKARKWGYLRGATAEDITVSVDPA